MLSIFRKCPILWNVSSRTCSHLMAGWPVLPKTEWPESVANTVRGIALGAYVLALLGFFFGLFGGDLSLVTSFPRALVLAALMAVPPTLAMLSYPDHPRMLIAAGLTGLVAVGALSILGLILVVLGAIWIGAYIKLGPEVDWARSLAMIVVPVLWLAASTTLWIHLDPVCEQRLENGRVIRIDPLARGFESGWTWDVTGSSSFASGPTGDQVRSESCSGDEVVLWEAMAAIILSGTAVAVAILLARPAAGVRRRSA